MLSGDNQKTATAIGLQVGVDESFGDLLPEGKVQNIEILKNKYGVVAMIGDGINDAPAMAKSSIGIAMGFVGSDTAIETADMTLMIDDLNQVAVAADTGAALLVIMNSLRLLKVE